jgi:hypothetical protein
MRGAVPAQLHVQGQALLQRGQVELGQPRPLGVGVGPWHAGQRHALPQRQRFAQQRRGPGHVPARPGLVRLADPLAERGQVDGG